MRVKLFAIALGSLIVVTAALLWMMDSKVREEQDLGAAERLRSPVRGLSQITQSELRNLKRSLGVIAAAQSAKLDWTQFQPVFAIVHRSSKQIFADPRGPAASWSFERAVQNVPALNASEQSSMHVRARSAAAGDANKFLTLQWFDQGTEWVLWAPMDYLQALLDLHKNPRGTLGIYTQDGQVLAHSQSEYIGSQVDKGGLEFKVLSQKSAAGMIDHLSDDRGELRFGFEKPSQTNLVVMVSYSTADLASRRGRSLLFAGLAAFGVILVTGSLLWLQIRDEGDGADLRPVQPVLPPPTTVAAPPPSATATPGGVDAKDLHKEYERVLGMLGRELKGPLATMLGHAQSFSQDGKNTSADAVLREARSLKAIVDQFLSYSNEESLVKKPARLSGVLAKVLREYESRFNQAGVKVTRDLRETTEMPLAVDALEKVLRHLFNNALDAMERMPQKELVVRVTEDTTGARIVVQDNGEGIEEGNKEKIFNPFFTTRAHAQRMGMGLAVCRGIAREHGGDVEIVSEQGKGATATLFVPKQPKTAQIAGQQVVLSAEQIIQIPPELPASGEEPPPPPAEAASPADFDVENLFALPEEPSRPAVVGGDDEKTMAGDASMPSIVEDESTQEIPLDESSLSPVVSAGPVDLPRFEAPARKSALDSFRVNVRRPGIRS